MPAITPLLPELDYPTSDGKPMAETDLHIQILMDVRRLLARRYEHDQNVYVAGNNFVYYERGNRRKHLSPDVYVVFGVQKKLRKYYLLWEEGKGPDFVIKVSSESTREEDLFDKLVLYRDVLKVREYFLFDPWQEYLDPSLQAYRLEDGKYHRIEPIDGRLPSQTTGLHLEACDTDLRLFDPAAGEYLKLPEEAAQEALEQEANLSRKLDQLLDETSRIVHEKDQVLNQMSQALAQRERVLAEQQELLKRQQQELEELRRRLNTPPKKDDRGETT